MATTDRDVAIVTGGSTGLGLEMVKALAREGWTVVADARGDLQLRARTSGAPTWVHRWP